jgi:type VI secretion system protein
MLDPPMMRRGMLMLMASALLPGCGVVAGTRSLLGLGPAPVAPSWQTLLLRADADAGANSALAVDVVLVKDTAVLSALLAMPAATWFATRDDVRRSYPEALTVYSYELVPAQHLPLDKKLWRAEKAWAALVYVSYAGAGEHRARLLLDAPAYVVQLGKQGFSVTDIKPGAAQ